MVKKKPEKCSREAAPTEGEDPGREAQCPCFEPVSLEIKHASTAVILLQSREKPILTLAAAALANYAEKNKGNIKGIFDLETLKSVLGLIDHEDPFTQRFALKLLSLMAAVPNVQAYLLESVTYIEYFTKMLRTEDDSFLLEFASRILAELTSDALGRSLFVDHEADLDFVFAHLEECEPDTMRNCMEILANTLKDPRGLALVTESKSFTFCSLCNAFSQPYSQVHSCALQVIEGLVKYNANESLQQNFRSSGCIDYLFELLETESSRHLRRDLLRILGFACDNRHTAAHVGRSGGARRFAALIEDDADLGAEALEVLLRLLEAGETRGLDEDDLARHFCCCLRSAVSPRMQALVCRALAALARRGPLIGDLLRECPLGRVMDLLSDQQATWLERQAAAFALMRLFTADSELCHGFLERGGQEALICFIQQPVKDVPTETQVTIVQALEAITQHGNLAEELIGHDLFDAFCSNLERENEVSEEMRIACCFALAHFPMCEAMRFEFIRADGPRKLLDLVEWNKSVAVRAAVLQLVLLLSADDTMVKLFNQLGFLVYLLKYERPMRSILPTWGACIDSLFSGDLPMKFAYTGRLTCREITDNGFYVLRRSGNCPFPVLEELFRLKLCPLEPIYVANFGEASDEEFLQSTVAAFNVARETMRRESIERGLTVSDSTIVAWLELKFGRLQADNSLVRYLEAFKAELVQAEQTEELVSQESLRDREVEVSRIGSRARRLARFVARQMSGFGPSSCVEQQLEVHLRAIRDSIETSVIPLGMLRVGGPLERALLFKVLADRLGIPAAIVRGSYGSSWIELPMPKLAPQVQEAKGARKEICQALLGPLPPKYLHEVVVIDLMNKPGELIPMDECFDRWVQRNHHPCRK